MPTRKPAEQNKADFDEADYVRLGELCDRDPRVVDLIISITGGCTLIEAAERLTAQGARQVASGEALVDFADLRATAIS